MTIKQRLTDALQLWGYSTHELEGMKLFFDGENLNNQFYRRILLKNFFAIIETYLFISKETIIIRNLIDKDGSKLNWQEISLLSEKKASLNSKGEVIDLDVYQNFIPSFRFTLITFAKAFSCDIPDFSDVRYNHLQTMVKRRNDITHPKSAADIFITNDEIKILIPMLAWFMNLHGKLNESFTVWLEKVWNTLED